jgi:hypothetical protein
LAVGGEAVEQAGYRFHKLTSGLHRGIGKAALTFAVTALFLGLTDSLPTLAAREKDAAQYGAGLIVNVPFSEDEVTKVVQEIVQNGIIRGTKEFSKDEFVAGAESVSSTKVFPESIDSGKVFYKIRLEALDPRNFKDTSDTGTLAVRYVVQSQDDKHTVLRIDARFMDDFRHVVHPSNGSVESAEYKDIHDHLDTIALMKQEAAEAQSKKADSSSRRAQIPLNDVPSEPVRPEPVPPPSEPVPQTTAATDFATPVSLEERVHNLRQQVERLVKSPGAPLKSAPFHTASTLRSLPSGTEVLIVISTTYWFGVETHDGQHGWILRDQLELLP